MTAFDDNFPPLDHPPRDSDSNPSSNTEKSQAAGDPFAHITSSSAPSQQIPPAPAAAYASARPLPEDLQISWSWLHLISFIAFSFVALIVVQGFLATYYAPRRPLPPKEFERYLFSKPQFIVGSNVIWFATIFIFLFVTLAALPGRPFWKTLGWRQFKSKASAAAASPWFYILCGAALSLLTTIVGSQLHTSEDMPIDTLFKSRTGALMLMAMAVFIAPLVEETVFRGYLYPLMAKWFGIVPGILVTGILFGLMHGAQLGWNWGVVALLILVGIAFTFARAKTGTVLASFFMHFAYNAFIAILSLVGTRGFTHLPPVH